MRQGRAPARSAWQDREQAQMLPFCVLLLPIVEHVAAIPLEQPGDASPQ